MLAEVDEVLGDRRPTIEDIEKLPWTTACFLEAMRMLPPAWIIPRRCVADDEIGGVPDPEGRDGDHPDPRAPPRRALLARPGDLRPDPLPARERARAPPLGLPAVRRRAPGLRRQELRRDRGDADHGDDEPPVHLRRRPGLPGRARGDADAAPAPRPEDDRPATLGRREPRRWRHERRRGRRRPRRRHRRRAAGSARRPRCGSPAPAPTSPASTSTATRRRRPRRAARRAARRHRRGPATSPTPAPSRRSPTRSRTSHGPVDVLVNNAGVGIGGRFLDATAEDWDWLMGVNLDGVGYGCHSFGRRMVGRGHGHVVNVASGAAYVMNREMAAYCASKAAVVALSRCLRADWADDGVGVSAICPGVINTPIPAQHADGRRDGRAPGADHEGVSLRPLARPGREGDRQAVEKNQAVVPVGIEAELGYRVLPFVPGPIQALAAKTPIGRLIYDEGRAPPRRRHRRRLRRRRDRRPAAPGGDRRLRDLRAQRVGRRDLVRAHLPGLRLRHPDPPLLVLVRPQPALDAPVPEAGRDPRLRARRSPTSTTSPRTSASAARWSAAPGRRTRGAGGYRPHAASSPATSSSPRSARPPSPTSPRSPASTSFEGHRFHSARWDWDHDLAGERVAVIGTGPGGGAVRAEDPARGRPAVRLPAHAAVGDPALRPPGSGRRAAALPAAAAGPGRAAEPVLRSLRGVRRRLPGPDRDHRPDRGARPRPPAPPGRRPGAAREAVARLPLRLQAPDPLEHVLPGAHGRQCRARHRPDHGGRRPRDRHRRRPPARGRHDHHRDRLPLQPLAARRPAGRGRRPDARRGLEPLAARLPRQHRSGVPEHVHPPRPELDRDQLGDLLARVADHVRDRCPAPDGARRRRADRGPARCLRGLRRRVRPAQRGQRLDRRRLQGLLHRRGRAELRDLPRPRERLPAPDPALRRRRPTSSEGDGRRWPAPSRRVGGSPPESNTSRCCAASTSAART